MVLGDRASPQLHGGMLGRSGEPTEEGGMGRGSQGPALRQIGSLIHPAPEANTTPIKPRLHLRHGVGTILGMKKGIGKGIGMQEVLAGAHHAGERMLRRKRLQCFAELLEFLIGAADAQQPAVVLQHVEA